MPWSPEDLQSERADRGGGRAGSGGRGAARALGGKWYDARGKERTRQRCVSAPLVASAAARRLEKPPLEGQTWRCERSMKAHQQRIGRIIATDSRLDFVGLRQKARSVAGASAAFLVSGDFQSRLKFLFLPVVWRLGWRLRGKEPSSRVVGLGLVPTKNFQTTPIGKSKIDDSKFRDWISVATTILIVFSHPNSSRD